MKLILENWKKYLKEHEDEEYEDDDEDLPLGKHVWPKDAIDPDPEKSKEVNTDLEEMLKGALSDHFNDKEMWSDPINAMKELIDKNLYPEVFKRYTKGDVYRGIYVSERLDEGNFRRYWQDLRCFTRNLILNWLRLIIILLPLS